MKIHVRYQWLAYLSQVGIKDESQLDPIQLQEMKRAFYGGFGQALMAHKNTLVQMMKIAPGAAERTVDDMLEQITTFWLTQNRNFPKQ